MAQSFVRITRDEIPALERAIRELSDIRVLVGIPQESARRDGEPISNAELGYIHNFGAPEANIPQREFMAPGIVAIMPQVVSGLRTAATKAVGGDLPGMEAALIGVGLQAQSSIRKVIQANIPPPLAESTIQGRIRRRKSIVWRKQRRAAVQANLDAGRPAGAGLFTALIDTGKLINSITFVLRRLRTGRDIVVGKFR